MHKRAIKKNETKFIVINTISKHRKIAGITQEQLAEQVGVTRQTIIAIEKGNYTPSVTLALRFAQYFEKQVEQLFSITKQT